MCIYSSPIDGRGVDEACNRKDPHRGVDGGRLGLHQAGTGGPETGTAPAPSAAANLADYHNGLTDADRQTFYHLSEGGEILPLALLQALERKRTPQDPPGDGLVPFTRTSSATASFPTTRAARIPFGLPVGMTVARSRLTNRVMVGFNCTTCHVGELWRNGRRVRIDGGPNMIRLNDMFGDIKTELDATLKDTRPARAVPGERRPATTREDDGVSRPIGRSRSA